MPRLGSMLPSLQTTLQHNLSYSHLVTWSHLFPTHSDLGQFIVPEAACVPRNTAVQLLEFPL